MDTEGSCFSCKAARKKSPPKNRTQTVVISIGDGAGPDSRACARHTGRAAADRGPVGRHPGQLAAQARQLRQRMRQGSFVRVAVQAGRQQEHGPLLLARPVGQHARGFLGPDAGRWLWQALPDRLAHGPQGRRPGARAGYFRLEHPAPRGRHRGRQGTPGV